MALMGMTVEDFIAETASSSPAPGGGTVSAVVGAFAAALGAMVCRLTIGNEKYPEAQDVLPTALKVLDQSKEKLILLADADTEAFNKVMAAFKLPKETAQEKAVRKAAIAAAHAEAASTPLQTAQAAIAVAEALVQVVRFGNINTISDCGVGIECAHTAAQGAFMNVSINLPSIKDPELAAEFTSRKEELEKCAAFYYDTALGILKEKLQ